MSDHIKCMFLNKSSYFSAPVLVISPICMKLIYTTMKVVFRLNLLNVIDGVTIIIVRICFVIGNQIAFMVSRSDFPPCKRRFMQ